MNYLIVISMIMIIFFLIYILYLVFTGSESDTICPVGNCPTNIFTGIKDCSTRSFDPSYQVCNPADSCTSTVTPYSINSDGSSNLNGLCSKPSCPCSSQLTCPRYITSMFTTNVPINNVPIEQQRVQFPQINTYTTSSGQPSSQPPLAINTPGSTFCTVNSNWLPRATPGCPTSSSDMSFEDIQQCMIAPVEGVYNPCLQGVLSLIVDNPDKVTQNNMKDFLYGCTVGTVCNCQDCISVYSTLTNSQQCIKPRVN